MNDEAPAAAATRHPDPFAEDLPRVHAAVLLLPAASSAPPLSPVPANGAPAAATSLFAPKEPLIRGDMLAEIIGIRNDPALKGDGARRSQLISQAVVKALRRLGRFYYNDDLRTADGCLFFDRARKELCVVRSDWFLFRLSEWSVIPRNERVWDAVVKAVENAALAGPTTKAIVPDAYWATRGGGPSAGSGSIYVSNGPGTMVKITASGLRVVDNGADGVLFEVGKTLKPWTLTDPVDPFTACSLFRDMETCAAHGKLLTQLWLYSMPFGPPSKPPCAFSGPVGSGKTTTARGFARLYGIPEMVKKVKEDGEDDFWVAINAGGILTMDNADTRTRWLADALAAASTGGVETRRRLYRDTENVIFKPHAWLCVTSSAPSFASDAGLADRLLVVRMKRRAVTDEARLFSEIDAFRDASLSHVAIAIQKTLADQNPVPKLNLRHPDWAEFALRLGRSALGKGPEAEDALKSAENDKSLFCIENDPIAAALLDIVNRDGSTSGTASDLKNLITQENPDLIDKISSDKVGKRITSLIPHFEKLLKSVKCSNDGKYKRYELTR